MNNTVKSIIEKQIATNYLNSSAPSNPVHDEDIVLYYSSTKNSIDIKTLGDLSYGCRCRLMLIYPFIEQYILSYKPKSFELVISLGDINKNEYSIPSICFSRKKNINSILIPNIDFFTACITSSFFEVENKDIDYRDKLDSSIFIGSSTGVFDNNTRLRFCSMCYGSNKYNSYINNLCQADPNEWEAQFPDVKKYLHNEISITDQLKYKVVVNIDGNTVCWSRLYWQMMSNSIPLYIDKKDSDIQFFDYLDPSEGYISCSLENSLDTIDYILGCDRSKIDKINLSGKKYIISCFGDYFNNPVDFLQEILNETINRIIP